MVGQHIGGFSQLAGGLTLFDVSKHKVGAIGVSGNPFWKRNTLTMSH
jgi:uncharacterized protein GlcG (DUF336 family)